MVSFKNRQPQALEKLKVVSMSVCFAYFPTVIRSNDDRPASDREYRQRRYGNCVKRNSPLNPAAFSLLVEIDPFALECSPLCQINSITIYFRQVIRQSISNRKRAFLSMSFVVMIVSRRYFAAQERAVCVRLRTFVSSIARMANDAAQLAPKNPFR